MISKLIMVGCTTQNNKVVNGQSMMFQLFVNKLHEKNVETIIVDFGKSIQSDFASKRISGKFSYIKLIDNLLLIFRYLFVIIANYKIPVYINTSQSKVGFVRDFLFINLAKIIGKKVTAHQFGSNYSTFYNSQSPFIKALIRSTFLKLDKIVVEGEFTREQFNFLKNYKEKVVSIPNGLPEEINSKTIKSKLISYPIRLIYLSNLIESKGYWDVLKAIELLVNRDGREIKAIFSGKFLGDIDDKMFESPEKARLAFFEFIVENNLTQNVQYYEGLYGDEKRVAFDKSHFFLLPSYYINEGQPVSVLEALAYGCVPIVTKYRLIPDMVNDDNGFFVKPKSPSEIATVINKMIENPENYKQYSNNGINFYLDNFTAEKYVNKLINLVE